jgi:hypothetical protein
LGKEIAKLKEAHKASIDELVVSQRKHETAHSAQLKDLAEVTWTGEVIRYVPGGHLKGIIASLASKCGNNVHDCGVVNVTASSDLSSSFQRKYAANLTTRTRFVSADSPNSWLKYDFKGLRIRLTHYTLLTQPFDSGDNHLRHWKLEGSKDDATWELLHTRPPNNDLNGHSKLATYSVGTSTSYRYFRITSLGPNHSNMHHLILSGFELFGVLMGS